MTKLAASVCILYEYIYSDRQGRIDQIHMAVCWGEVSSGNGIQRTFFPHTAQSDSDLIITIYSVSLKKETKIQS